VNAVEGVTHDRAARDVTVGELELQQISKRFGGVQALDGVDLTVVTSTSTALLGPNGSGKSTLLGVISGFVRADSGSVRWNGRDLTRRSPRHRVRSGIARTFQQAAVFGRMSVRENLEVGALAAGRRGASRTAVVERSLDLMHLEDWADRSAASIPFGVARRLAVGAALTSEPAMLLLDEPAAGLSDAESSDLIDALRAVLRQGVGMVLVDHSIPFVTPLCERLVVLSSGRVIADGGAEVLEDPEVVHVFLD
jgi:ABC-type branched-subunit amino acid transport system ATPase component